VAPRSLARRHRAPFDNSTAKGFAVSEFRDKALSIGVISRRSGEQVREYRDASDGHRVKATTDELGNTVTEHNVRGDRQDVTIKAPTLRMGVTEERDA